MFNTSIPNVLRGGGWVKTPKLGLEVPSFFYEGLKGLDSNFYLVWHSYKLLWDNIINQYSGSLEDSRFVIGPQGPYGAEEIWGFVLTDGQGNPKPDNAWHVWRLCPDVGWAHIFRVEENTGEYYHFTLDKMNLCAQIQAKQGNRAWLKYLTEEQKLRDKKARGELDFKFKDVLHENRAIMRQAYENAQRRIVTATKPTKDIITSYSNQSNKSRIVRPLTDREGGWYAGDN